MALTWIDADTYLSRVSAREEAMNLSMSKMMELYEPKHTEEEEFLMAAEQLPFDTYFNMTKFTEENRLSIQKFRSFMYDYVADLGYELISSKRGTMIATKKLSDPTTQILMTIRTLPIDEKFSVYAISKKLHVDAKTFRRHLEKYARDNGFEVEKRNKVGTWLRRK